MNCVSFLFVVTLCSLAFVQGGRLRRGADLKSAEQLLKRHKSRDCGRRDAPECEKWASFGLCSDELYNVHCARTCGFCKKELENEVQLEERHKSRDCGRRDAPECEKWASFGLCSDELYNVHCARTCGFCKKELENEVQLEERHKSRDCGRIDAPECEKWASFGLCSDELYNVHCARTCGFCKKELQEVQLEESL
ncbi:hypothetical protein ACHWQZ_G012327 [Mnemiopsis leidyi]